MAIPNILGTDFFTDAISKINDAIDSVNAMSAINNMDVINPMTGDYLSYDGISHKWKNSPTLRTYDNVVVNAGKRFILDGDSGSTYIKFDNTLADPQIQLFVQGSLVWSVSTKGAITE